MTQVIEQSNTAYEQRDKSRMEIVAIDQANKKEKENFDKQMEEMGKGLEADIDAAAEKRKSQHPSMANVEEESKIAAEKAAKANALMRKREALAKEREKNIRLFEESFNRIERATGISDVDELVQQFKENDENNFSLFTFANEQANEIEELDEQINNLAAAQQITDNDKTSSQIEHFQKLKEIEMEVQAASKQARKFEKKTSECQHVLESLKDGIKVNPM